MAWIFYILLTNSVFWPPLHNALNNTLLLSLQAVNVIKLQKECQKAVLKCLCKGTHTAIVDRKWVKVDVSFHCSTRMRTTFKKVQCLYYGFFSNQVNFVRQIVKRLLVFTRRSNILYTKILQSLATIVTVKVTQNQRETMGVCEKIDARNQNRYITSFVELCGSP